MTPENEKNQQFIYKLLVFFVIPLGFEPKTHSLEGCCSIQLSYGTFASEHKINAIIPNLQKNINPAVN